MVLIFVLKIRKRLTVKIAIEIVEVNVPIDKLISVVNIKAKLAILIPFKKLEKYFEFLANLVIFTKKLTKMKEGRKIPIVPRIAPITPQSCNQ